MATEEKMNLWKNDEKDGQKLLQGGLKMNLEWLEMQTFSYPGEVDTSLDPITPHPRPFGRWLRNKGPEAQAWALLTAGEKRISYKGGGDD